MSEESRWTFTGGSKAGGVVIYDDGYCHSFHDTDPGRGSNCAWDLVRKHLFGRLDTYDTDTPIADRPSTKAMENFCRELPELRQFFSAGFTNLDDTDTKEVEPVIPAPAVNLPAEIDRGVGRCTDLENARRIQRFYGKQIISVAGNFYIWQETHWALDQHEGQIWRIIAQLSRMVAAEARSLKDKYGLAPTEDQENEIAELFAFAPKCDNKPRMDAAMKLLQGLLNFDGDKLNTHRNLFAARNTTIDLQTGALLPHDPNHFITACAPTDYDPAAQCPHFERFLLEIFEENQEIVAFLKRWLGYCITGENRAQALVFHVGTGGNGKSTLMKVLGHVVGSYAVMGARSLLSGKSAINNDVASLVGKRMVTISEPRQDEEFDQGQLKDLTGGDNITARFLHKEFFEFAPTHKIQIFTNHEPEIRGNDGGMWRRLLLLRYNVRYGLPEEVARGDFQRVKDEKLEDALKAEAPGILRWLVEGAREWYASGLQPPSSVLRATEALRAQQDLIGLFLKERTVEDPAGKLAYSGAPESLYGAYQGWTLQNGHRALGRARFLRLVREARPRLAEELWQHGGERVRGLAGIRLAQNGEGG